MDVLEMAKKRSAAAENLRWLGQANAYGRTAEQAIAAAAQYQLAVDAYTKADADYRAAIAKLTADELSALAKSE